jgi:hypothetical protein
LNAHEHARHEVVETLLYAKAEVNFVDQYGKTALHYVVEEPASDGRRQMVRLLCGYRADPNIKDNAHGRTAFEVAASDDIRQDLAQFSGRKGPPGAAAVLRFHVLQAKIDARSRVSFVDGCQSALSLANSSGK